MALGITGGKGENRG